MNRPSLDPFFAPRSVAVIGASRDPSKVGGSVLANLRSAGFEGRIVPVNARAGMVQGLAAVPTALALQRGQHAGAGNGDDGEVDRAVHRRWRAGGGLGAGAGGGGDPVLRVA